MAKLPISLQLLLLLLATSSFLVVNIKGQSSPNFRLAQSFDCGIKDERPGDIRTKVPWVASIFIKDGKGGFKFLSNGVVIGPTTVFSVLGGAFGQPTAGGKKRYTIPPPDKFAIAAGITSTDLKAQDSNAQIVDVEYILPYSGHEEVNNNFHFVLYHTKTLFSLTTPYVRPICLPFLLRGRRVSPFGFRFIQGGLTYPPKPDGTQDLEIFNVIGGSEKECTEGFQSTYNTTSGHVFCGKTTAGNNPNGKCLLHGSITAFELANRWFMAGITSLIPSKKNKKCPEDSLYYYARTLNHLDWILESYKCSPRKFACGDGNCIPISSTCNGVKECKDGSDEEPRLCAAANRCTKGDLTHSCGYFGKCIAPSKVCDGQSDCADKSDEHVDICKA